MSLFDDVFNFLTWENKIKADPGTATEYAWSEEEWPQALKVLKVLKEKGRNFRRELYRFDFNGKEILAIVKREKTE